MVRIFAIQWDESRNCYVARSDVPGSSMLGTSNSMAVALSTARAAAAKICHETGATITVKLIDRSGKATIEFVHKPSAK